MKIIKMQDGSVNTVYSGVYKITFPNNKVYIGISNNMYRRMLEHNTDFRNNLPIEHAIQKYGKITEFKILEEIRPENRTLMREREQYWIQFYHSNQKEFGYNISIGGDGADSGSNNHEAKFTEEEIQAIYYDLKNELSISLEDLSKKYGINITTLSRINNGVTYYHSSVAYPVRSPKECKAIISGTKSSNAKLDEGTLFKVYDALLHDQNSSMASIAKKFGISQTIVQNINMGKTYINTNFTYPLRHPKLGVKKLTDEQVDNIIYLIKTYPKKSFNQIGYELGINSKTVSSINLGKIYKRNNETYPIRRRK